MSQRFKFIKKERLKSRKSIESLFSSGRSLKKFPLILIYEPTIAKEEGVIRFAVSVPKKRFKSAVRRNLLKRRIREAYRLNKHLINTPDKDLNIMFVYYSDNVAEYDVISKSILHLIGKINEVIG